MAEPLCPYFPSCSGCSSQNISYELQLQNKRRLVETMLKTELKVFSAEPYNYRNRIEFIFKNGKIGLRQKRNPSLIIKVDRCAICDKKINSLLREANDFFEGRADKAFRFMVIRNSKDSSSISIVLDPDSSTLQNAVDLVKNFSSHTSADNLVVTYSKDDAYSEDYFTVKGNDELEAEYLEKRFIYPVQGFFQNNQEVAGMMQEYCRNILKGYSTDGKQLLDLFCGVGTFGIINHGLFDSVIFVENYAKSIEYVKKNAKLNGMARFEAFAMDAKHLSRLDLADDLFVITDPPRSGMDAQTISQLNKLNPSLILYISCNPHQLKKDIPKFKNHKVKSAALFDMFPQTNHMEIVVELIRS
ncbi:class I SAM-dependent RNA methyltransferase [Candidatus Woesearchaeota archaeon]|nr:class I SAM-dependent RNA methyltransferase [Candidatus Woesearchaeota archaeon]